MKGEEEKEEEDSEDVLVAVLILDILRTPRFWQPLVWRLPRPRSLLCQWAGVLHVLHLLLGAGDCLLCRRPSFALSTLGYE